MNQWLKKSMFLVLILSLVFALAACSSSDSETTDTTGDQQEQQEEVKAKVDLTGTWKGTDSQGVEKTLEFSEGKKVTIDGKDNLFYLVIDEMNVVFTDQEVKEGTNTDEIVSNYTVTIDSETAITVVDADYQSVTYTKQ